MKKTLILLPILALVVMPLLATAQEAPPESVATMSALLARITILVNWFFAFFLVLAVFFLLWAAFMYLTSAGDEEKVGKAKKALIWAIVALVVAFLAKGIITLVKGFVTVGT